MDLVEIVNTIFVHKESIIATGTSIGMAVVSALTLANCFIPDKIGNHKIGKVLAAVSWLSTFGGNKTRIKKKY